MNEKHPLSSLLAVFGRRNRLRLSLFVLVLVASFSPSHSAVGLSPIGAEDPGNDTYHSTASEVRLVFFATDEHNHNVQDLYKDDFAVVDDENVIREFRSFTPSASIKLDVIVLIDSSDSFCRTSNRKSQMSRN